MLRERFVWRRGVASDCPSPKRIWLEDRRLNADLRGGALKRMLLIVWAAWLTVVCTTNVLDGLKTLGMLPEAWAFASGNYRFLTETTARYGAPGWVNALLFSGVIAWDAIAALLFWRAGWLFRVSRRKGIDAAHVAFGVSLCLWGAFLLADEVFIAYDVEGTHLRIFTAQLATLFVVELLPDRSRPDAV